MALKFALLGAGRIGKTHAQAISGNPDAELVVVSDPVAAAAQAIADKYVRSMLVSQQEGNHAQEDEEHRSRA